MRTTLMTGLFVAALTAVAQAQTEPPPPPPPPPEAVVVVTEEPRLPVFGIGAKVGVLLPGIATELGPAPMGGLELSVLLPVADRRLGIYAEVGYSQPTVSRSNVADPRVGAGTYDSEQTQKELVAGGGLIFRFAPPMSVWNGYLLAGARGYFLKTVTVGSSGGNQFGENTEQSSKLGGYFALGGERRLGPGAFLVEVGFGTSGLDHKITGDVSTSAIAIQLGYRFLF